MSVLRKAIKRLLICGLPLPRFLLPVIRCAYRFGIFVKEGGVFVWKILVVEPVLRAACKELGRGLRAERIPYMRGSGHLRLGNEVNLSGQSCFYFTPIGDEIPEITIGDRTFVGHMCTFVAGKSISVGHHCLISPGVRIHDNDGHPADPARRLRGEKIRSDEAAAVQIGNNVWIGAAATILKGVTVGDNSIIAAGAVVLADVPENMIVGGNLAQPIMRLPAPPSRDAEDPAAGDTTGQRL